MTGDITGDYEDITRDYEDIIKGDKDITKGDRRMRGYEDITNCYRRYN